MKLLALTFAILLSTAGFTQTAAQTSNAKSSRSSISKQLEDMMDAISAQQQQIQHLQQQIAAHDQAIQQLQSEIANRVNTAIRAA